MNRGDLHWVEFPGRAGHAQSGRRPAIIAQGASASQRLPTVLVIPLTTQQDALRFPWTVLVEADATNGLRRASVALTFQLTVLDQRFIGNRVGAISDAVMRALWRAFDEITERNLSSADDVDP